MKLGAEQFESIVGSLRSFAEPGRQNDKRRSPRVGLRMEATFIPCVPGAPVQQQIVRIRDLSAEGIGLTHSREVAHGSYFIIAFRRPRGEVMSVLYRVAHCRRLSDRAFAVGATFDRVISANDATSSARRST